MWNVNEEDEVTLIFVPFLFQVGITASTKLVSVADFEDFLLNVMYYFSVFTRHYFYFISWKKHLVFTICYIKRDINQPK